MLNSRRFPSIQKYQIYRKVVSIRLIQTKVGLYVVSVRDVAGVNNPSDADAFGCEASREQARPPDRADGAATAIPAE